MPMIPFAERFPGIAENEMLTLPIEGRADLQDGEYFFKEARIAARGNRAAPPANT